MDEFFRLCRPVADTHNKKNSTELYKNLCKISSRTGYTQAQRGSEVGGQRQAPAALSPKMTQ